MSTRTRALPAARRQTYVFLEDARRTSHVYLMTKVDAAGLREARAATRRPPSYVSYVVKATADVLAGYPDARAVLSGRRRPRLTVPAGIHAKVLFDKTVDGRRCVVSGTVPNVQDLGLDAVQETVERHKRAPVDEHGPFARIRRLQRLPLPVVRLLYRAMMRNPHRAAALQGTFAVTSIGHEPVDVILPLISGPLGLGVGHIEPTPCVRDGEVVAAPAFTLSLVFDHRVLDGAMAAEILGGVKNRLEKGEWHD
jgi:pyruvate/2-oxoglutarate dehydrogenase complex dihydrolipoamide acyltransferase (E2) component